MVLSMLTSVLVDLGFSKYLLMGVHNVFYVKSAESVNFKCIEFNVKTLRFSIILEQDKYIQNPIIT